MTDRPMLSDEHKAQIRRDLRANPKWGMAELMRKYETYGLTKASAAAFLANRTREKNLSKSKAKTIRSRKPAAKKTAATRTDRKVKGFSITVPEGAAAVIISRDEKLLKSILDQVRD